MTQKKLNNTTLITILKLKLLLLTSIQNPLSKLANKNALSNIEKLNFQAGVRPDFLFSSKKSTFKKLYLYFNFIRLFYFTTQFKLPRYNTAKHRMIDYRAQPVQPIDYLFGNIDPLMLVSLLRRFKIAINLNVSSFFFNQIIYSNFYRNFFLRKPEYYESQYNFGFYKSWAKFFAMEFMIANHNYNLPINVLPTCFSLPFFIKLSKKDSFFKLNFHSLTLALNKIVDKKFYSYLKNAFFKPVLLNMPFDAIYLYMIVFQFSHEFSSMDHKLRQIFGQGFEFGLAFARTQMITYYPKNPSTYKGEPVPRNQMLSSALRAIEFKTDNLTGRELAIKPNRESENFHKMLVSHFGVHYPFSFNEKKVHGVNQPIQFEKRGKQTLFFFNTKKCLKKKQFKFVDFNKFFFLHGHDDIAYLSLKQIFSKFFLKLNKASYNEINNLSKNFKFKPIKNLWLR